MAAGTYDVSSIMAGPLAELIMTPLGASAIQIGSIKQAAIAVEQTFVEHEHSGAIAACDYVLLTKTGMRLECMFEEQNATNWALALGGTAASSTGHNYLGVATQTKFYLVEVKKVVHDTGFTMICHMNKAAIVSQPNIAASDGIQQTPLRLVACRSVTATGSNGASAANPLAYILVQLAQSTAAL